LHILEHINIRYELATEIRPLPALTDVIVVDPHVMLLADISCTVRAGTVSDTAILGWSPALILHHSENLIKSSGRSRNVL
jgi:hypothetical protein